MFFEVIFGGHIYTRVLKGDFDSVLCAPKICCVLGVWNLPFLCAFLGVKNWRTLTTKLCWATSQSKYPVSSLLGMKGSHSSRLAFRNKEDEELMREVILNLLFVEIVNCSYATSCTSSVFFGSLFDKKEVSRICNVWDMYLRNNNITQTPSAKRCRSSWPSNSKCNYQFFVSKLRNTEFTKECSQKRTFDVFADFTTITTFCTNFFIHAQEQHTMTKRLAFENGNCIKYSHYFLLTVRIHRPYSCSKFCIHTLNCCSKFSLFCYAYSLFHRHSTVGRQKSLSYSSSFHGGATGSGGLCIHRMSSKCGFHPSYPGTMQWSSSP